MRIMFHSSAYGYPVFPGPPFQEAVFSPVYVLNNFVKNALAYMCGLFLRFPLMSVCRLYQSRAVLLTMALQYFLKSNIMVSLALFFCTSSLVSAYEFQSCFPNSEEEEWH